MNYSKILKSNYKFIIATMLIVAVLALAITALQTFKYQATTRLLVIQKQVANLDAYTAAKSGERIAKNLAEVVYTSSFYDNVIDSNMNLKKEFSDNETERRKEWQRDIEVNTVPETGLLAVSAYNANPEYAAQIARSIAFVLVNRGGEYHGGGPDVEIKIVDNVLVSKYPARPNVFLNLALGLLIGLVFSGAYAILKSAKKAEQLALNLEAIKAEKIEPTLRNEPAKAKYAIIPPVKESVKITTFYDHIEAAA